jgi:hypothetical protein
MEEQLQGESSLRRSCLALHVCAEILLDWEQAQMPTKYAALPRTAFEIARHFLLGILSRPVVEAVCSEYIATHEDCMGVCDWEEKGDAVFAYHASRFILFRVLALDDKLYKQHDLYHDSWLDDESVRPTEKHLADDVFWDTHFIASANAAKGAYWEPDRCDDELRRRFWIRWLDETLPQFVGDLQVAKVKALLL